MIIKIYCEVVKEVLVQEMECDECVVFIGEDLCGGYGGNVFEEVKIEVFGGVLGVIKGLWMQFGFDWVIDMFIIELVIIGMVVGVVVMGLWLVVELMFMDFFGVSYDVLYNQVVKFCYMFGGKVRVLLVM